VVGADVIQRNEIRVLQIEALRDAAELDIKVAANQLERDFLAGVAGGEVDFTEAAATYAALDRVAFQRPRPAGMREFQRRRPRPFHLVKLSSGRIHCRKVLSF
jgi:hypothetical protein